MNYKPPQNNRIRRISFRVNEEEELMINLLCKHLQRTWSDTMRFLIRSAAEDLNKKKKSPIPPINGEVIFHTKGRPEEIIARYPARIKAEATIDLEGYDIPLVRGQIETSNKRNETDMRISGHSLHTEVLLREI